MSEPGRKQAGSHVSDDSRSSWPQTNGNTDGPLGSFVSGGSKFSADAFSGIGGSKHIPSTSKGSKLLQQKAAHGGSHVSSNASSSSTSRLPVPKISNASRGLSQGFGTASGKNVATDVSSLSYSTLQMFDAGSVNASLDNSHCQPNSPGSASSISFLQTSGRDPDSLLGSPEGSRTNLHGHSGSKRDLFARSALPASGENKGAAARSTAPATPMRAHFGPEPESDDRGDAHLQMPALQEENASLEKELESVKNETKLAKEETDKCLAALPAIHAAIFETREFLQTAQIELGHFEAEIEKLSAQKEVGTLPPAVSETDQLQNQLREHLRLQQLLDKLEAQDLELQQECQNTARNAAANLQEIRLRLRQDLERREHRAHQCGISLQDSVAREKALRVAYQQRFSRFQQDLHSLSVHPQANNSERCREDALHAREAWEVERKTFLQEIAHLEAHTAEVRSGAAKLQQSLAKEEQEEMARKHHSGQGSIVSFIHNESQELQAAIDVMLQRARTIEQEVVVMRERRQLLERRSVTLLRNEWEECAELEACSKGGARASQGLAKNEGEAARTAGEELREAQSQAKLAERGLREALLELQQQQDMLGHQLQTLWQEPRG